VTPPGDDRIAIGAGLVRRLVAARFPQWARLDIAPVPAGGWDNRTFRLGADMSVRLPSHARYAAQVTKEHEWLPRLAPGLPLAISASLAIGEPAEGYPWPWSVRRWIEGEPVSSARIADSDALAGSLAQFLTALHRIDAREGPPPGEHNFHRGGDLSTYDAEVRQALADLGGSVDGAAAKAVWEQALGSRWSRDPVWVHGDVSAGNLLARDGRLVAVIDFGCCAVGDPACDLAIAWTFLDDTAREVFRQGLDLDAAGWERARGLALWKALITLAADRANGHAAGAARHTMDAILADHRRG